jgi:PAS domain S-box-containing protein
MSLRRKTLLIVGSTLVGLLVLFYAAAQLILLDSLRQLEVAEIQEDVARVYAALAQEEASLAAITGDYAHWDDTYAFVQDANRAYVESNLMDETFINLQLNLMVFVNRAGEVVLARAFDLRQGAQIPVPSDLDTHLTAISPLLNPPDEQTSVTGLVMLGDASPLLVAAVPILTSQYEGPSPGTLLFGRFLDERKIEQLADTTHLSPGVTPLTAVPDDIQRDLLAQPGETPVFVQPLNEQIIAGYSLVHDIYGNPGFVLSIEEARHTYQHGMTGIHYLMLTLLGGGLVLGAGTLLLLEKAVLYRLARLSDSIRSMGDSTDLSIRVPVLGRDELAHLGEVINWRLEALEQTQHELHRLNAELEQRVALRTEQLQRMKDNAEAILNATRDAIAVAQMDGFVIQTNPAFNELFSYGPNEAIGIRLSSILDKSNDQLQGALDTIATGRLSRRREVTARRQDGATFDADMMLAPIKRESGELRGIVCSLRDITERVQAEERQRTLVAGLRAVVLSASDLIACPDVDSLFRRAVEIGRNNLRLERCAIYLEDEGHLRGTYGTNRYGNTTDERAHAFPLDSATWRERLNLLKSGGPQWLRVEEPLSEWDGEKAVSIGKTGWIAITPIPALDSYAGLLFNDNGITDAPLDLARQEVVAVYCSLLGNIYQRKLLEEDLQRALEKEKQLNELKSRFSSMISHEFRTPWRRFNHRVN